MKAFANLDVEVPERLEEELLKRIPYVSEGIRNPKLTCGGRRLTFDLLDPFAHRAAEVSAAIADVARRVTRDLRVVSVRTLTRRDALPSSFRDDPHPLLEARGDIMPLGLGRYALGPRLVALMAALDARIGGIAAALEAPSVPRFPRSSAPTCSTAASIFGTSRPL